MSPVPGQAPRTRAELAAIIDHTLLRPGATRAQVEALCAEASAHGFASVCVNPSRVALARTCLQGQVPVCTVVKSLRKACLQTLLQTRAQLPVII